MVSIVSGNSLGLNLSSLAALGQQGSLGNAAQGRSGEQVFVNADTGNLVIQERDDILIGTGLGLATVRTYNSQGKLNDDNADNWAVVGYRSQMVLFGTLNAVGSTLTRTAQDGAEGLYIWNAGASKYVSTAGSGAYDTIVASGAGANAQYIWTDGDTGLIERYNQATGRLESRSDTSGNTVTYAYNAQGNLASMSSASGEATYFDYSGVNLTQIRTVNAASATQTRTRYGYDASNRLSTVTVDLTPEDNAIADGKTYVTTYTYDGTSNRVASITQSDGSSISFAYTLINGDYRVTRMTDGLGHITNYGYTDNFGPASTLTASANSGVLSTSGSASSALTGTLSTTSSSALIASALTTPVVAWGTATLREALNTAAGTAPQVTYDQNGNGMAVWALGTDLYYSLYSKSSDTWSAAATLDGTLTGSPTTPNLTMSANGNALVTWVQNSNIYARRYIAGVWDGATTIPLLENATGVAVNPVGAINDAGRAVVAFAQTDGTRYNLLANVYNGAAWLVAPTNLDDLGTANTNALATTMVPSVAIDVQNNATVTWLQKTATQTVDSLYFSRYTASTNLWSNTDSTTLESATTAVTADKIASDSNGNGLVTWLQGTSLFAKAYTKSTNTWGAATTLSTTASGVPSLSLSSNGTGLVAWRQGNDIYARRYAAGAWIGAAAESIEALAGVAVDPVGSINNSGQAVVVFIQNDGTVNNLYANRYTGSAWSGAVTLESNANTLGTAVTDTPSVAIDASGNINTLWLQKTGTETNNSVYSKHYNALTTPYYTLPASPTWAAIAKVVYGVTAGNAAAAGAVLQSAMGNPTLVATNRLSGFPATLSYTVPAYYSVPAGATWTSITQALYGTSVASAAAALQTQQGNLTLTTGLKLVNLPATLSYNVAVAPYYTVASGDSWASITQSVYGTSTSAAVSALQTALGNPTLTLGLKLTVPASISYSGSTVISVTTNVTDALGNITILTTDATGQLTNITGPAANGASQSISYTYNANGDVTSATDARGFVTTYVYDASGNQTRSQDAAGNTLSRTYGSKNQLLSSTLYFSPDPDGAGVAVATQPATSRFAYDANNRLRFSVSAEGRVSEYRYNSAGQRVASIGYSANLYPVAGLTLTNTIDEAALSAWVDTADKTRSVRVDTTYDFRGQVASVTQYQSVDANGDGEFWTGTSTTQYIYDQTGNLLQTIAPKGAITQYSYDGLTRQIRTVDSLGVVTLTQYDDANNKTSTTLANGLVTTRSYTRVGELISTVQSDGTTALGSNTYTYDNADRLKRVTDATGVASYLLYDTAGRKVADLQADGSLTEYVYNANNQVVKTIQYAIAVSAANRTLLINDITAGTNTVTLATIKPATNTADRTSWAIYDKANRLAKSVDELGFVTEVQYDGASQAVASVRYNTALTTANRAALTIASLPTDAATTAVANANDRKTRNFFDKDGKQIATLDAAGYLTENQYDAAGRLIHSTAYATRTPSAQWASGTLAQLRPATNANDQHSWLLYNSENQVIATVDAEGYCTEYNYDRNGNKTQAMRYTAKSPIAPQNITSSHVWEDLRPLSYEVTDRRTEWTYTDLNQLQMETQSDIQSGYVNYRTQYTYDVVGKLIQTQKDRGYDYYYGTLQTRTLQVRYDKLGRVTAELSGEGSVALLALGESPTPTQINAVWRDYGLTHTYDSAGRRTSTTDAVGNKTRFYYNTDGQLTHSVNALGEVTERKYNALNQVTQTIAYGTRIASATLATLNGGLVTTALTTAVTAITNAALDSKTTYSYTLRGQVASTTTAVTGTTSDANTSVYNAFGETSSTTQKINATTTVVRSYTYDKRGQLSQTVQDASGINSITSAIYDAFGRMTSSTDARGNVHRQTYDRLGRVISTQDPLNVNRSTTYNAFAQVLTQTDALGHVTRYDYSYYYYGNGAQSVRITTPEGIELFTSYNDEGNITIVRDGKGSTTYYTYDVNGNHIDTHRDGTAHQLNRFDAANRLVETTDANGNKVSYTYDAANRMLSRTVDPEGLHLVTSYTYDAKGQQVSVMDANGNRTDTAYDLKGQVLRQTVDPTGLALQTAYEYDARGLALKVTLPDGSVTQYTYDKLGRRVQEVVDPTGLALSKSYTYDKNNNVTSTVDANGQRTCYAYDALDRLVYTVDPLGQTSVTSYDAQGRITQTRVLTNAISLTGLGNAPTVAEIAARISTSALDTVHYHQYDNDDRLSSTVNGLGEVTTYQRDANGNVTEQRTFAQRINLATWTPGTTPVVVANDAQDHYSTNSYDSFNRLFQSLDGTSQVSYYSYDANGNVLYSQTNYGFTQYFVYDAANRMVQRVDGEGVMYRRTLDGVGRVLSETTFATRQGYFQYPGFEPVTDALHDQTVRHVYDAAGRERFSMDATGAVQENRFNANGQVIESISYVQRIAPTTAMSAAAIGTALVPATNDKRMRFSYDAAGRQNLSVTGTGAVTQIVYDGKGNVVKTIEYATRIAATGTPAVPATSADDRVTLHVYDAANRLSATVDALGGVVAWRYDAKGNQIQRLEYAARSSTVPTAASTTANATTMVTQAQTLSAGSVHSTRQIFDTQNRVAFSIDGVGAVTRQRYDAFGQLRASTAYATALSAASLAALPLGATATDLQALVQTSAQDRTTIATYDGRGQLIYSIDPAGFVTRHDYDGIGRVILIIKFPQALTGFYTDLDTNLTTLLSTGAIAELVTPQIYEPYAQHANYSYNSLNQVLYTTEWDYNFNAGANAGVVETATYDAVGNRLSHSNSVGSVWDYTYDSAGHLVEEQAPTVPLTSVSLDANGNLVASDPSYERVVTRYAYDGAGQLTSKTEAFGRPEQRTTTYQYDADGRLIKTTLPPVGVYNAADVATIAASGAGAAARAEQLSTLDTQTVYNAFGDAVTTIDAAGEKTHHVFDALGHIRFDIDALGQMTEHQFDAYGNATQVTRYALALSPVPGTAPTLAPMNTAATALHSAQDRSITTTYDGRNQAVRITQSEVWVNNGQGGLGKLASPVTEKTWDAFGQLVQESRLVDTGATPATNTWATTRYAYDMQGNQVACMDAMGYLHTQSFNPFGDVLRRTEYANALPSAAMSAGSAWATMLPTSSQDDRITLFTYDSHHHVMTETRVNVEYSQVQTGLAPDGTSIRGDLTRTYGYDGLGRLTLTTEQTATFYLRQSTTGYDALGRVSHTGVYDYVGGGWAVWSEFAYDALGNLVKRTGYYQQTTLTQYNHHGQAVQTTETGINDSGVADATSVNRFMSYTATGQLAKTWQGVTGNDGVTQTVFSAYQYDAVGNNTAIITPASTSAVSGGAVTQMSQAAAGTVVQDMVYNAFGEVASRGQSGYTQRETYTYDNAGKLVRKFAGNAAHSGVTSFMVYDLLGRQTVSIESAGSAAGSVALNSVQTAAAADALGVAGVRRTDTRFDLLGRAVQIVLPQRLDLGTSNNYRPVVYQTFDRWGNLLSQSDPRQASWVTHYRYNSTNQVIECALPQVGSVDANGNAISITPTTQTYYDQWGREVAQRDAKGNVTGKEWIWNDTLSKEYHADGGVVAYGKNYRGNRLNMMDAMGNVTYYTHDGFGRTTSVMTYGSPANSFDANNNLVFSGYSNTTTMVYDELGRLLRQTNGNNETTSYTYDARGNIIATMDAMGHVTKTAFDANGNKVAEQNANGDISTNSVDYFGQTNSHTDYGGVTTTYTHDQAGQLTQQTSTRGQNLGYQYDGAGNLLHATDTANNQASHYGYDARGSRILEQTTQAGVDIQLQTLAYDSLGRLAQVSAQDGITLHRDFDANNNLLRQTVTSGVPLPTTTEGVQLVQVGQTWTQTGTQSVQVGVDPNTGEPIMEEQPVYGWQGFSASGNQITTVASTRTTQTQWFAYDAMNRQILVDGAVNGNAQDRANLTADQGHILAYDLNGNRTSDTHIGRQVVDSARDYARDANGNLLLTQSGDTSYGTDMWGNLLGATAYTAHLGLVQDQYTYDQASRVSAVTYQAVNADGSPSGNAINLENRYYDAAGRLIQSGPAEQLDASFISALTGEKLSASGIATKKSHYNAVGQLTSQQVVQTHTEMGSPQDFDTGATGHNYSIFYDQLDAMGNILAHHTVDDQNGDTQNYTHTYQKRDSYLEVQTQVASAADPDRPSRSYSTYDTNHHLVNVRQNQWNGDGSQAPDLERAFTLDANGTILRKTQQGHELKQLVVAGQVISQYGKGTDPDKELNANGKPNYVDQGEFATTYQSISSKNATGASSYTAQAGDTLRSIASGMWGDAALWYRLADTNGLTAVSPDTALTAGLKINAPAQVAGTHNTSETFRPYDPGRIIGDTTPAAPPPPQSSGGGCGGLGQILMIVIAVVVTYYTGGALAGSFASLGATGSAVAIGAIAGATGSVASQAFGVAAGIQKDFSWDAVGMAAIGGGVGAGLSGVNFTGAEGGSLAQNLGTFGNSVIRAAVGNAMTQGIGVATGLQKSFSWAAVASAAVTTGVNIGMGQALGQSSSFNSWSPLVQNTALNYATGLTMNALQGGSLTAQDVAVSALGNAIGSSIGESIRESQQEAARNKAMYSLTSGYGNGAEGMGGGNGITLGGGNGPGLRYGGLQASTLVQDEQLGSSNLSADIADDILASNGRDQSWRNAPPIQLAAGPGFNMGGSSTGSTTKDDGSYDRAEMHRYPKRSLGERFVDYVVDGVKGGYQAEKINLKSWANMVVPGSFPEVTSSPIDNGIEAGKSVLRIGSGMLQSVLQLSANAQLNSPEMTMAGVYYPQIEQDRQAALAAIPDISVSKPMYADGSYDGFGPSFERAVNLGLDAWAVGGAIKGSISLTSAAFRADATYGLRATGPLTDSTLAEANFADLSVTGRPAQLGANSEIPFSRLSQNGGLSATEGTQVTKANGQLSNPTHPLAKHGPDVTDQYIYDRVANELANNNRTGLRTAFNDRAQMENAIAETFTQKQADINAWISSGPRAGVPKAFEANPGMGDLGRGFEVTTPGGTIVPITQPMPNVNLVLIPNGRGGYLIHTAHPY